MDTDFRLCLRLLQFLEASPLPEMLRWRVAIRTFFREPVPEALEGEAMEYLAGFLSGGRAAGRPGPKLLDWQLDAPAIMAGVNRVAGTEVRSLPRLHWWTFLSWFHGIGEGQVSALVSIRDKLQRGKKLEGWEKEFYRQNRDRIQLKKKYSPQELLQRQRLEQLLG
jgi:hypothetical protein